MNKEFWINRWKTREIGWHQNEVEPALIQWRSTITPGRILVPLCGKSLDLTFLKNEGFQVMGVELSETACLEYFKENNFTYTKTTEGQFEVFRSDQITIYNGDFFNTTDSILGPIQFVYDRAALIALPPELREKYTAHIQRLTEEKSKSSNTKILQIILSRTPHDEGGPPFSIQPFEVENYYAKNFNLRLVSEEKVEARGPEGSTTRELVYYLERKQ